MPRTLRPRAHAPDSWRRQVKSSHMLVVDNLCKQYSRNGQPRVLFEGLSLRLDPAERLAVLGRNGQGKSTFIKIIGGVLAQTSGQVKWTARSSWPLGFAGGFQGGLSGLDNIRFLARIYDRDIPTMIRTVERFAELGDQLKMPVTHYSTGMRARLAFGLSLAIEFDCYLIDEVISVGDALFQQKCETELFGVRAERGFVIASHDMTFIRGKCQRALLIDSGRHWLMEDVNEAVDFYEDLCRNLEHEREANYA